MKKKILMVLITGFLMFCMAGMATATSITRDDFSSGAFEYDFEDASLGADTATSGLLFKTMGGAVTLKDSNLPAGNFTGQYYSTNENGSVDFYFSSPVSAIGMDVFSVITGFTLELFDGNNNLFETQEFILPALHQFARYGFIGLDVGSQSFQFARLSTMENRKFDVDNLICQQASAPVPEPSTILLFGFGLAGLAGIARERVKK